MADKKWFWFPKTESEAPAPPPDPFKSPLIGLIQDALVVYDENFNVLVFNKAAEDLFKIRAEDVLKKKLKPADIEKPELRTLIQVIFPSLAPAMVSRSPAGASPQIVDVSFASPQMELRTSTSAVEDENGNTIGFMKLIHDRTHELSLIKSKNDFLTIASHQLKSPLTDVKFSLEGLAQQREKLDEEGQVFLDKAAESVELLLTIVNDILNMTKIEEGRFGYNFQEQNLEEFLRKVLEQVQDLARRAGVKVYFEQSGNPLPPVFIDPEKLSLAMTNLLDNAVRYNVKNGNVVVKAEKVSGEPFVRVSVKDTGVGISEENLKKLFTKFFRPESSVKIQTEGSGLGLYITKNIIQAHGGRIWAESEANRGSAFYFTVPTDKKMLPTSEAPVEY